MPQELLGELVREGKELTPSRLALVWRDQETSYLTLDGQIDRAAAGFSTGRSIIARRAAEGG